MVTVTPSCGTCWPHLLVTSKYCFLCLVLRPDFLSDDADY